jgi:hypothetical protein
LVRKDGSSGVSQKIRSTRKTNEAKKDVIRSKKRLKRYRRTRRAKKGSAKGMSSEKIGKK